MGMIIYGDGVRIKQEDQVIVSYPCVSKQHRIASMNEKRGKILPFSGDSVGIICVGGHSLGVANTPLSVIKIASTSCPDAPVQPFGRWK